MDKEKQIEKIQNTLIRIAGEPYMIEGLQHWSDVIAEKLYNEGYRKASEVAFDIIEKILKYADSKRSYFILCSDLEAFLNSIKKKYIGEPKE